MLRKITIAVCSTTWLWAACAKPDQPGAAKPTEPASAAAKPADAADKPASNTPIENQGIAMMQRMGDMFAADANDCEKLAADIKAFIAQNTPLINQLNQAERTQSPDERDAFEKRNKGVQDAVMQKMNPAITACGGNSNVQSAMKQFPSD